MKATTRTTPSPFVAKFDIFRYSFNEETRYFDKVSGNDRLPNELHIEPVRNQTKYAHIGITHFLRSRQVGHFKAVNTDLQPVSSPFSFSGDILLAGKKSLAAIQFNDSKTEISVYVFWGFWKEHTTHRLKYVRNFLKTV